MSDIVASYHCMQFQGKLTNQIWENDKKTSFGPDFGPLLPKFVPPQKKILWILPLLDVRHCCKAINVCNFKELMNRTWEMVKNLLLDPILVHLTQIPATNFFFQNLTFLVTRYHGQLCTILEKTNDLILRKCIDGRTDGWMDLRTDG